MWWAVQESAMKLYNMMGQTLDPDEEIKAEVGEYQAKQVSHVNSAKKLKDPSQHEMKVKWINLWKCCLKGPDLPLWKSA